MTFYRNLAGKFPALKHQLHVAHLDVTPEKFVKKVFRRSLLSTLLLGVLLAMLVDSMQWSWFMLLGGVLVIFAVAFFMGIKKPLVIAHRRAIDINREVLFAGRFILVKLHSGMPLVNALMEAANSYGVANKYFDEIVRDIELGTPLEDAMERSMNLTPSDQFRKVLFQIHNALRLGIDVTSSLEAVLDEITQEQLLEIQKYGKKLSTVTLFYMLVAIVFPSLGMTITTVLLSFTSVQMDMTTFGVVLFFLIVIQFLFITVFNGIRPKVNI